MWRKVHEANSVLVASADTGIFFGIENRGLPVISALTGFAVGTRASRLVGKLKEFYVGFFELRHIPVGTTWNGNIRAGPGISVAFFFYG